MKYREIETKYLNAGIKDHFKFSNASEVLKVLGYDIRHIGGFDKLSDENQSLAEILMCRYINGYGLEARENLAAPKLIKRGRGNFIVTFTDKRYIYLFDDGSVG